MTCHEHQSGRGMVLDSLGRYATGFTPRQQKEKFPDQSFEVGISDNNDEVLFCKPCGKPLSHQSKTFISTHINTGGGNGSAQLLVAPTGTSEYTTRRYAALFGALSKIDTWHGHLWAGLASYVVTYHKEDSTVLARQKTFDTAGGDLVFSSGACSERLEELRLAYPQDMMETQDKDAWRFSVADSLGAGEAAKEAAACLSAQSLAQFQSTLPAAPRY